MAVEIERKFLLRNDAWRRAAHTRTEIQQGYIAAGAGCAVRVRIAGEQGFVTIKGATTNVSRAEFEYAIPDADAREMLDSFCGDARIVKTRHSVRHAGHEWVVDEFHGTNTGLVVAEIELSDEGEAFERPPWVENEVSHDRRYRNSQLVAKPYRDWPRGD